MLLEHDHRTLANMTAALDFVYGRLPKHLDTKESRTKIAQTIMEAASAGKHEFVELRNIGLEILAQMIKSSKNSKVSWFGFVRRG